MSSPYAIGEALRNLSKFPSAAIADWASLRPMLVVVDDVVSFDRPVIFTASKGRPFLFAALASSQAIPRRGGRIRFLLTGWKAQ